MIGFGVLFTYFLRVFLRFSLSASVSSTFDVNQATNRTTYDVRNTGLHSTMGLGRTHYEFMKWCLWWNNPLQYDINKALAEKI